MISSQMRSATYRNKRSFSGISVWIALMLLAFVAHANDDEVIKKLIGTWEGAGAFATQPTQRTLVIKSIKREGDSFVGEGSYGNTGGRLSAVDLKIAASGADITVEFRSSANNDAVLKLRGDRELSGKIEVPRGTRRSTADLTLSKVE